MQPQVDRDTYRSVLISCTTTETEKGTEQMEERGDLARFYNLVFLPRVESFLKRFVVAAAAAVTDPGTKTQPPLTPLPAPHTNSGPLGIGSGASGIGAGANSSLHSHPAFHQLHGPLSGISNESFSSSRYVSTNFMQVANQLSD